MIMSSVHKKFHFFLSNMYDIFNLLTLLSVALFLLHCTAVLGNVGTKLNKSGKNRLLLLLILEESIQSFIRVILVAMFWWVFLSD